MDNLQYAELFLTESREHVSAVNHALLELERDADGAAARRGGGRDLPRRAHDQGHGRDDGLRRRRRARARAGDACSIACAATISRSTPTSWTCSSARPTCWSRPSRRRSPGATAKCIAARSRRRRCTRSASASRTRAQRGDVDRRGAARRRARSCAFASRRTRRCAACARSSSCRRSEKLGEVTAIEPSLDAARGRGLRRRLRAPARHDVERRARSKRRVRAAGDVADVQVGEDAASRRRRRRAPAPMADAGRARRAAPACRRPSARRTRHVRIDVRRLDTLMNLVGELVIARGRLHAARRRSSATRRSRKR